MKKRFLLFLSLSQFLFFFTAAEVKAQQNYDFAQFGSETYKFIQKPFSWDKTDILTAGGIILGTAILMQADEPVKDKMMEDRSCENKGLMRFGTIYGDAVPHIILGAGLLAHGYLCGDISTKRFGFEIAQALTYTGAVTIILKGIIGRGRPSAVDDAFTFSPFALSKGDQYQSLPSGHSSVAFAMSTVFASKFKNGWLKALCYTPAFITAFSRVYNNRHWFSDVFLGAFIGHFIGRYVVDLHDGPIEINGSSSLSINLRI